MAPLSSNIQVTQATHIRDLTLHIEFSDGTSRTIDFAPFLLAHPHPQHNHYRDPDNFKNFKIEHGNIVWGKNWDFIFPIDQLYQGAIESTETSL